MTLDEFTKLVCNFCDKDFPVRELPYCYNSAIRTQIDEINFDRHYELQFAEFLEAICRVIDIQSPIPINDNQVIFLI